jgi:hypothetical protein
MSAQEIINELPKLTREDFLLVKQKLQEIDRTQSRTLRSVLTKWAGKAEGLPSDFSENHDHYIHGTPKNKP